jgi:class 3 adenylate cyclase/tetratricopeptide (TPR) repeat protein
MICAQCQSDNPPNAAFCDECGARLETACPNCGESNRRSAKFCRNCLAEKILATRHILEGERKQVTVLFADIRGSTSLVEGIDPEEAQKIIDPVLHVMMDAVHRYEGTVNQVLGDGVMALFGAPLAHEDHALRACYAALAMQEEMRRHRRKIGQSDESGLQIGIGMNTGEVVVRFIDNDLNIEYSALGQTTHLAARMQELAGRGSILMTAPTLRQVEGFIQVKSLGAVQAKGVSHLVEAYELIGATSARTRVQAAATRGLTPLVGRRTEMEVFSKLVEQVASGKGQILAMVGEPGMGKSRLVHEFTRHQLRPGWLVLEGASVSYGKATPYFPVIELLRRYFEISEGDGTESILSKILNRTLELDEMLKDAIPPILALLSSLPDYKEVRIASHESNGRRQDVGDAIKKFNDMEPQQRRRRTFESLKRLMVRESQKQPLLIVFEDLHWVDNETQAFLHSLIESLPMTRILLLVDYRPEYSHSWGDKTYYTQLRVDPLHPTSAEELLQHLLGRNADLAPLKELLIRRTEGNPFFAEECVRSLVEAGVLVGEKGAYRPALRIDEIRIPSTVQSVVADRIDRLPIEEKHLLQMAAIIGVIVPSRVLRAVAELSEDEIQLYLAHLQEAEFLCETALFPELEYTFKHALTNEVACGALLHERRTSLHARIVGVLETIAGDSLYDHIEAIAHHALHGELWDKAVTYLRQAGVKAMSHSGFAEALSWYEQASNALKHLPESRQKLEQDIDLHLDSRNALFLLGDLPRIAEHLHAAESLVETLGDRIRMVRVFNFLNSYYGLTGDPELAIRFGQRASALISESDGPVLSVMTDYYLGAAYNKLGKYSQAINVLKRAIGRLVGDLRYGQIGTAGYPAVTCRGHLVQCLAAMGEFREGVFYAEEGVQIAEEVGDASVLVYVNCSLAFLYLLKGDLDKAIPILERALTTCRSSNIPVYIPFVSSRLGFAYANAGRVVEGLPFLEQGVEDSASAGRLAFLSLSTAWLSEGHLLLGHLEKADVLAGRALKIAKEYKEHAHEAWALKLLGDVAMGHKLPKTQDAESYYRQAFAVSLELGMRPLQAHCHLGRGKVYAAVGAVEQARTEMAAATDLYRSMEMNFWLVRANAVLDDMTT